MSHQATELGRVTEMLRINAQQTAFYEAPLAGRGNLVTRTWRRARHAQIRVRKAVGIDEWIYQLHLTWMGELSNKRVLDLGCYAGNPLSLFLAKNSKSYLGIDLSKPAIEELQSKLQDRGISHAEARAVDFLSPDFTDNDFDIIYAHSVAHHFRYFDVLLQMLNARLRCGGKIITYDPLSTSLPVSMARKLYRPFQSDKEWEFPFTKQTFRDIQRYFRIVSVQGTLGYSKWALPLAIINTSLATSVAKLLHSRDLKYATALGPGIWRCILVSMCWEKL